MRKFLIILLLLSFNLAAQQPVAKFLTDSVEVGSEVKLSLSYLHPNRSDLIFPDSSFDFSPFQFVSSELFEAKSVGNQSLDSVVYTLITYQIDQELKVQPYIIQLENQKKIYANTASIFFKSLVSTDKINLLDTETTVKTFPVKKEYNLFKLVYTLMGLIFISIFVLIFFRSYIERQYKRLRLYRDQRKFINAFRKMASQPGDIQNINNALNLWKRYLQKLTKAPLCSMSTLEIGVLYDDNRLESALRIFDQAIFGRSIDDKINLAFHSLRDFAIKRYRYEKQLISG